MKTVYLIGSLRNAIVPEIAATLREKGFDAFDDWHAAGPEADDEWQKYEHKRGRSYQEALDSYHAYHVFDFDKHHIDRSDMGLLVLPAGKSGHLELGYLIGVGKPGFILLEEGQEDRFDVMYRFASYVSSSLPDIIKRLRQV